jgi:XTP/dITP diphosphohydrolase
MRILLATGNAGKLREYRRMLSELQGLQLESLQTLGCELQVLEDGATFYANALKKARAAAEASGLPAMADDSGLEVDALQGKPGVRSARYSGEGASDAQNNEKLLAALAGLAPADRTARFRCAIVVVGPNGDELAHTEGSCEGRIAATASGTEGFGYDPIFIPAERSVTMAQLLPEEKNQISHRAQAVADLLGPLRHLVAQEPEMR